MAFLGLPENRETKERIKTELLATTPQAEAGAGGVFPNILGDPISSSHINLRHIFYEVSSNSEK